MYGEVVNGNWQSTSATLTEVVEIKQIRVHIAEINDLAVKVGFSWG